jgi:hypothetical protein
MSLNQCVINAQPYIARWINEHPKWVAVRWRRGYSGSNEKTWFTIEGRWIGCHKVSVMSVHLCIGLRTGDCDDGVKPAIATKLIALAKAGERNPDILCEEVLKDIRRPQRWAASEAVRSSLPESLWGLITRSSKSDIAAARCEAVSRPP